MSDRPNYCRRTITQPDQTEKVCGKRIERANALNWCPDCRVRLPWWPTDEVAS